MNGALREDAGAEPGGQPAAKPAERVSRAVLLALCTLPLFAYLPRVLRERDSLPALPPARWVHLLVVTAERFDGGPDLELAPFAELEVRSTRPLETLSTSTVPAAAAASLWTGRWPHHHGVLAADQALAPDSWTLASALRASGARSAAFLASPFVTTTGLAGFEQVFEDPAADPEQLATRAAAFIREHSAEDGLRERIAVWVHLRDAGPGGAQLANAVETLRAALREAGALEDCVTLVTALSADPGGDPAKGERRYRVPLWLELPAALFAGRRGQGTVGLLDLALPLVEVLAVEGPDALRGEAELQSRPEIATALAGGVLRRPFVLHEPDRHRWLDGPFRVSGPDPPPAPDEDLLVRHARLGAQVPDDEAAAARERYRASLERLTRDATPAVRANLDPAWSGRAGW